MRRQLTIVAALGLFGLVASAIAQTPDFGRGGDERERGGRERRGGREEGGSERGEFRGGRGGPGGGFGGPGGGFGGPPGGGFGGPGGGGFGGPGGAPDPGRFFGFFDRNGDGTIDPEELLRLPAPLLQRLQESGLKTDSPISKDDFVQAMERASADRMRESDGDRGGRRGDEPRGPGRPDAAAKAKEAPVPAFIRELPEKYRKLDKNNDRQLTLSEWDRANLAEFRKLDLNKDGYLTPQEVTLALAQAGKVSPRITAEALSISVGLLTTPGEIDEILRQDARETFARMDNNSDGGLDEDEWGRSQKVRPLIEQAGIKVTLPVREPQFVASFVEAKKLQP